MRKCLIAFLCGLLIHFQVDAQNKVIKGRVTDETNNPVPNASVVIKGANAGAVTDANGKVTEYSADHIIIATGARSRELPNLPQDGKKVIGYRQAMTLPKQPKKMIVVGSGAIGVEFAHFYNSMGTDVTIVEFMPNVVPVEDIDVSKQFETCKS